jgi:hypothetical protein
MSVKDAQICLAFAVELLHEHGIERERQQFPSAEFDAVPPIEWLHSPIRLPKQPIPDVLGKFPLNN